MAKTNFMIGNTVLANRSFKRIISMTARESGKQGFLRETIGVGCTGDAP
jgi:hypothetical protein